LFSLAAFGQTAETPDEKTVAEQIQELVTDLRTREAELEELNKKIERDPDHAAAAMLAKEVSDRRAKYRRDVATLVDLVVSGEDAGAEVAQGRAAATEILQDDAPKMREKLGEQDRKLVELIDTAANGTPEEVQQSRQDFVAQIPVSTRLLQHFEANIDLRNRLAVDVGADTAFLTKRLQARGDMGAGLLKDTKAQIDEVTTRPGVDQDAEAQKELATLRKQRDALADSQRVNVDLMAKYGLETAELRRGIITATGKLSQDILDKEVASGLVESWLADGADWFRTNGTELVFQVLTFILILLAFWLLARIARGAVRRGLEKSKLSISSLAKDFFIKMTSRLVMLLGFIIAIAQLGVEVGPLLAGLGGIAGFVIGFALQDTLSNFASGLMILVYRPFDVGDAIEAGGVTGKVDQMPRLYDDSHLRQPTADRAEQASLGRHHSQHHAPGQAPHRHDVRDWILG
jgi:hypothetical protein